LIAYPGGGDPIIIITSCCCSAGFYRVHLYFCGLLGLHVLPFAANITSYEEQYGTEVCCPAFLKEKTKGKKKRKKDKR
jgi:hypothetical protein